IIPPSRKNRVVAAFVLLSFACSFGVRFVPFLAGLSGGTVTILLTVVLSAAAAFFFPLRDDAENTDETETETEHHDA
ncbi:MAG: branched-chain amino acid ABC transporter permease, partial [Eubacteriales bacterium]